MRELQPWLSVTHDRLGPAAQAAAIRLGPRNVARTFALTIPLAAITNGADISGVHADPDLLFCLGNRFEALEDEWLMAPANAVLNPQALPNEPIDHLLPRWMLAQEGARDAGADVSNFTI